MENPYEILGIEPGATQETIKAAYRQQARLAHPDRKGGSAERMADINRAYAILSDPDARSEYDRTGEVSKKVDPEARAREMLCMVFVQLVDELDENSDIIEALRGRIKTGTIRGQQELTMRRRQLARYDKRAKRIKGGPLFADLLADRRKQLLKNIDAIDRDLATADLGLEMLKSYSDGEEAVAQLGHPKYQRVTFT